MVAAAADTHGRIGFDTVDFVESSGLVDLTGTDGTREKMPGRGMMSRTRRS